MTSDARELSARSGEPIKLFLFARGNIAWCYTSAAQPFTYDTKVYTPANISHSAIEVTGEVQKLVCTVSVPADLAVLDNFYPYPTSDPVSIVIRTLHAGETDALVDYMGRCQTPSYQGETADIPCEPDYMGVRIPGLRLAWQPGCPYGVFDANCGQVAADYEVAGTLSSAQAGLVVTSDAAATQPDGYFAGGWMEWDIEPGISERRSILAHTGDAITLMWGSPLQLVAGLPVRFYPGCDGTYDTCDTKFNNLDNYGGDPFMPTDNPFDGNPVFAS